MTIHRKFFLRNTLDVRRYISRLMNTVEAGQMDGDTARTLGYLARVLLKTIELLDVQGELKKINEQLQNLEKRQK